MVALSVIVYRFVLGLKANKETETGSRKKKIRYIYYPLLNLADSS